MAETPLTDRLGELRAAVRNAEARVRDLDGELRKSSRAPERARSALEDYYRGLGAGEADEDPRLERELRAALADAGDAVVTRPVSSGGRVTSLTSVDVRIEGLLSGARQALEAREREVYEFAREHLDALLAERRPEAEAVALRLDDALRAVLGAEAEWSAVGRDVATVLREAGRPELIEAMPDTPLRGLPPRRGRVAAPLPRAPER